MPNTYTSDLISDEALERVLKRLRRATIQAFTAYWWSNRSGQYYRKRDSQQAEDRRKASLLLEIAFNDLGVHRAGDDPGGHDDKLQTAILDDLVEDGLLIRTNSRITGAEQAEVDALVADGYAKVKTINNSAW